jgi:hypothetical protein
MLKSRVQAQVQHIGLEEVIGAWDAEPGVEPEPYQAPVSERMPEAAPCGAANRSSEPPAPVLDSPRPEPTAEPSGSLMDGVPEQERRNFMRWMTS